MLRTHHYTKEKPRTRGFFQSLIVCEAKTSLQYSCYLYQLSIRITKSCGFVRPCKEVLEKLQFMDFTTPFLVSVTTLNTISEFRTIKFCFIRKSKIFKITLNYFACKTSLFYCLKSRTIQVICLKVKQQILADIMASCKIASAFPTHLMKSTMGSIR